MATVINNPSGSTTEGGNGIGFILGIIVVVLLLIAFFVYGLPAIMGHGTTVNVPDHFNVNVNGGGSGSGGGASGGGSGGTSGGASGY